jgi:hypothetical protein
MYNQEKSGIWDPNPLYIWWMAARAPIILHVDYITMIYIQFCSLNIIHYTAFNDTAEYTSLDAPK